MSTRGGTETNNTKKLKERFSELEDCNEIEQKQKIQEMNEMMDEMVENEFDYVFTIKCVFETSKLLPIYMPRILKVALKKEESEEIQKEVEIALLALRNVDEAKMKKERYLNEIKEIIKHHQEHHNLTRLAYLSAWEFFVNRFYRDKSLEEVFVNELHFVREARRELEELSNCVNWKRKKGENDGEKETKEEILLRRWLQALFSCFFTCELWNEEIVELLASTVKQKTGL
ncbi:uncharacterized protein MONOS_17060 [Monocercomonoides exilis]|uniref:uncharacterized protein n=1 Tax=Monocercomonoides exilis TaxID=2049356 RepID=UPI00355A9F97|nr:hypothetical protein MONOS_17060 [Monocercomonoides exilis]